MRIGILTGGGDAPALNAVIRAAVKTSIGYGWDVLGIEEGFKAWSSAKLEGSPRPVFPASFILAARFSARRTRAIPLLTPLLAKAERFSNATSPTRWPRIS